MRLASRFCPLAVLGVAVLVSTAPAANHIVQISDSQFIPSQLTIHTNDTVTWRNDGLLQHTSTSGSLCSPNGKWDSNFLNPGDSFTAPAGAFATTGSFPYYCFFHCVTRMTGTITVETPPVATENTTWGAVKALFRSATR